MGFFKIVAFVALPTSLMTYFAFSLGKQLPKASRIFGNYIGLGYLYFKSGLKVLKPEDHLSYEMIDVARRASQQSQALRRQLRNTMKKAKQQFNRKQQEVLTSIENPQISKQKDQVEKIQKIQKRSIISTDTGSGLINELENIKQELQRKKKLKKQSRKYFQQL